jgi:hypothetical protein
VSHKLSREKASVAGAAVSLERAHDRDVHGDLLLRLGAYRHTCDSYYLAIDDTPTAGSTVEETLARLLDQWVQRLRHLAAGAPVFLPFDFSDPCTAWLRVDRLDANRVSIQAGWSSLEGWAIMPSNFSDLAAPEDFKPISLARLECCLPDLITAIEHNRDAVRHDVRP